MGGSESVKNLIRSMKKDFKENINNPSPQLFLAMVFKSKSKPNTIIHRLVLYIVELRNAGLSNVELSNVGLS